ncbi:MAG: ribonuclease HII [Endomicrobiales bacterium]|nr:ribonuclease HII [Endomicrobiales bacterium]
MNLYEFDSVFYSRGFKSLVGVDEAGRGPWAGPVVAAAVILPQNAFIEGLNDSKKLSPKKRKTILEKIKQIALSYSVGVVSHTQIDEINILQATYQAMKTAIAGTNTPFDLVLVDGWAIPQLKLPQQNVISGDAQSACIAAASIVAKETRDAIMEEMAQEYPQYGFEKHKGYGTKQHMQALQKFGVCPIHRVSYAPIKAILKNALIIG